MKHIPLMLLLVSAGVLGAGSRANLPTPAAQNKKLVQRYFEEAWNQGRLSLLDTLLDKHYINHTPSTPNPPPGPDGLKPIVAAIRRAFPDLHYDIQDLVVNDSMAVARVIMTGTQLDSLFDLPATGKKISVNQINMEKIRNGKIIEHWRVTDELSLMKQLGFVK
jgi:steroid delta-isomerase-like uncharacterized protein